MSRIRNDVARLEAHVKTLRIACLVACGLAVLAGAGWWRSPSDLTVHVPPDLRSGSTRKWWDIPPESIYSFTTYIFQQLNSWPVDGKTDYQNKIDTLKQYLTPSCQSFLRGDYKFRNENNELKDRIRYVSEIPKRGYSDDPALRVKQLSMDAWQVNLDLATSEYYASEPVKKSFVRYPVKVVRLDGDGERNPWGLALDCYTSAPMRITTPDNPDPAAKGN